MPFVPWGPVIGNIAPPLPVASGGTGATTAAAAMADLGGLVLQASTPLAGFALQNATPNIITWTAPNDGAMHRVLCSFMQRVTVAETGGAVTLSFTDPGGTAASRAPAAGGSGTGSSSNYQDLLVAPGTAVTLAQSSALTAGTATVWAEIWGL